MAFVINRTDFFLCKNAVSPDGETAFCIYCFLFFFRRQAAVQTAAAVPAAKRAARPHLRTLSARTAARWRLTSFAPTNPPFLPYPGQ